MDPEIKQELELGLTITDTASGIIKQIGSCLSLALKSTEPPHDAIIRQLRKTADVLEVVRHARQNGFMGTDAIIIRVRAIPDPITWEDWFRATQHSIVRNLSWEDDINDPSEIDIVIKHLEDLIKILGSWSKGYCNLVELVRGWYPTKL